MSFKNFYPAKKYKWHVTPLATFKEMLEERQKNDLDNQILITGARRSGKSTLANKILFQFENYNPFEDIVYSKEALFKQVKKKNGNILCDESVVQVAKGNVMTRASKLLFEVTTINGENHNKVFFLMPYVEDFDSKILQYCTAWIHIDKRGLGVLLLPENKGIFGKRNWDIIQMKKIFEEFQKSNQNATHMPYWVYSNFRGYIKFGKLPKNQQEIVDQIKNVKKYENMDKTTQEQTIIQVKEVDQYAKYSAKQLAEFLIKGQIRSWEQFEVNCKDLKLSPEEMMVKCDSILKHNNVGKSTKGILREYEKVDSKIF